MIGSIFVFPQSFLINSYLHEGELSGGHLVQSHASRKHSSSCWVSTYFQNISTCCFPLRCHVCLRGTLVRGTAHVFHFYGLRGRQKSISRSRNRISRAMDRQITNAAHARLSPTLVQDLEVAAGHAQSSGIVQGHSFTHEISRASTQPAFSNLDSHSESSVA